MDVPNCQFNPRRPTQAAPGSPEKIAILIARAELEIPLHVLGDKYDESTPGMLKHFKSESMRMVKHEFGGNGNSSVPSHNHLILGDFGEIGLKD